MGRATEYVPATLTIDDRTIALHSVERSLAPREQDQREENELFAMGQVHRSVPEVARQFPEKARQEVFLLVLRAYVEAQYGKRDVMAEDATAQRYFRHYGLVLGKGWEPRA